MIMVSSFWASFYFPVEGWDVFWDLTFNSDSDSDSDSVCVWLIHLQKALRVRHLWVGLRPLTHWDNKATSSHSTSHTYLLPGGQGLYSYINKLAHLPHCSQDSNPGLFSREPRVLTTIQYCVMGERDVFSSTNLQRINMLMSCPFSSVQNIEGGILDNDWKPDKSWNL